MAMKSDPTKQSKKVQRKRKKAAKKKPAPGFSKSYPKNREKKRTQKKK